MTPPLRLFPHSLLGADLRRIRIGSQVSFMLDGEERVGEVVGWSGPARGVDIVLADEPYMAALPAESLRRVDGNAPETVTVGWWVVDDDHRSTLLVAPLGTRDVVILPATGEPSDSGDPFEVAQAAFNQRPPNIRAAAAALLEALLRHTADEQRTLLETRIDMPILRRVLDEASLPAVVTRIVFVVTDQLSAQNSDTTGLAAVAARWVVARGHCVEPDSADVRPILEVGEPVVIGEAPHLLEAVVEQLRAPLAQHLVDCERVVTVLAGGTPAMMYGTLLAAGALFGRQSTRSVQVPDSVEINGQRVAQALVELDLSAAALAPPAPR